MSTGLIVVKRDDLINAAETLDMVPQKSGIPTSDYIRFTLQKDCLKLSLASTVLGMVRVPGNFSQFVPHVKEIFIDRRVFMPFVLAGKTRKPDFQFGFNTDNLFVRQGTRDAMFALSSGAVKGYGIWKDRSNMKEIKLSQEIKDMILASVDCATADPSMPELNCVLIGDMLMLASNKTVIFLGKQKKATGLNFPFPVSIIPFLHSAVVKGVGVDGDIVVLDCGVGYLEGTVSAVARKKFPRKNLEEIARLGANYPIMLKLPAARLLAMLERFIGYLSGVRREDWIVNLDIKGKTVRATVNLNAGKFDEVLEMDEPALKDSSLKWPLDAVTPVVKYMAGATKDAEIVVRTDDAKQMPYFLIGETAELVISRSV